MTSLKPTSVAFLGAGNIAGPYFSSLEAHPELQLTGVFDLDADKRRSFARSSRCSDYSTLDELVSDAPDIVVNLTSAPYHFATTQELLNRGQNVFSEKPLALSFAEARELEELAATVGARLACAPSLWLGAACTATTAIVRACTVGQIRLVNAEVNQGRIETWHPAPESFYQVGPVVDVGVYPLAFLTAIFGAVAHVTAIATTSLAERSMLDGKAFTPATPDSWIVLAQFAAGPLLRLSCNFFVDHATVPRNLDLHGDTGSIRIDDWIMPGSPVSVARYGQPFETHIPGSEAPIDWCIGLAELAAAMREGRPHRASAGHAVHVVELLDAIRLSASTGTRVNLHYTFDAPASVGA